MTENNDKKTRIISYIIIAGILLTVWYMLNLVLLTFIVGFVFYHLVKKIKIHCDKVMPFNMPEKAILSACYILFIILLIMFISEGLPVVVNWGKSLASAFSSINITEFYQGLDPHLQQFLEYIDLSSTVRSIGTWMSGHLATYSTTTLSFMINLFIALILAFIILCERKRIEAFGVSMSQSRGA